MKKQAYYNEHDKRSAAWLRELIRGGHIADGDVDERSIADVRPADLLPYGQCHFFAGIGGWSLALRLAGIPDHVPVWTGSCPCQPFSSAGLGLGEADPRHLWPQFRRLVAECAPAIVIGEQVESKAGRGWLAGVRADLEALGYGVGAADLCAASKGAPHIRQRLFWMAYNAGRRWEGPANPGLTAGRTESQLGGFAGWLANGHGDGCAEHELQSRRWEVAGPLDAAECGAACGVGISDRSGRQPWQSSAEAARYGHSAIAAGPACGLGDSERKGRTGQSLAVLGSGGQGSWSRFDILPCTDGKARRIEPGSFPLADGIPGRVGLLRGYGNAIVPEVAAEFVAASMEALMEVLS